MKKARALNKIIAVNSSIGAILYTGSLELELDPEHGLLSVCTVLLMSVLVCSGFSGSPRNLGRTVPGMVCEECVCVYMIPCDGLNEDNFFLVFMPELGRG